ncbi:MAG: tetratricopeptide repeat protein [Candidatus Acidiferrales bacterium]
MRGARLHIFFAALVWMLLGGSPAAKAQTDVQALALQAQSEQQAGDLAAAERDYKAALAADPGFAELHMNLGLLYQLQNRQAEAMAEFERALKLQPSLAGANFFLGVDYCKSGEAGKAIAYLTAAAKEEPNRKEIWMWLASADEMAMRTEARAATLQKALQLFPDDIDVQYELGTAYEKLGQAAVLEIQKKDPPSFRAEQLLGESYAASSEWPVAVLHFQNAIALAPSAQGLHVELGEVQLHAGNWQAAQQAFDDELKLNPRSVRAISRRGETELTQKNIAAALQDWTQALAIDSVQLARILGAGAQQEPLAASEQLPDATRADLAALVPQLRAQDTPASRFALEFVAAQTGESAPPDTRAAPRADAARCTLAELRRELDAGNESAVASCAPSLARMPLAPALRTKAAAALFDAGRYQESLEILAVLQSEEAHSADVLYWRARSYEQLSAEVFLKLSQEAPDSYRVHQLLGDMAEAKGDDAKAIEEYRAAVAQKPALPELHYTLGHLLWKDLKVPEARAELQEVLKLDSHHAGALEDMGDTYLLEHQPDAALPYLSKALDSDAQNPALHRDLGTAYFEDRSYDKAEAEFKIALPGDHDGSVHYKLARLYQVEGQKEKAAKEFAISAELNRASHARLEKKTERLTDIEKSPGQPQ